MGKYIKNWFSNMLPMDTPIVHEDLEYKTVENFYMAMKTLNFNDREVISNLSARESKKYGRTVELREDWEDVKIIIMTAALQHKFTKGTSWYKKLMECEDETIVEINNWHDNFWGDCICSKCKNVEGQNNLGKIITEIRSSYRRYTSLLLLL
jgi:ribA/ribD-fused uncharacterized protein